jgi:hypothetical protein
VLLDEAHKGDREDSKRQHIYSILSRNGFLFNFSATFTDPRDIATTVYNFNLSEYIRRGYGKHLLVLQQELRAFKDKEDYSADEKRRLYQLHSQSSQLPPSLRFPPLREGNRAGVRFPLRAGGT